MPFIGNQPALAYTSFAKQDFTTSATTSYTLDNPVANENEIALFINFVRQEPTTAYTASGTSLTLTSATSASDDMYCVFLGKAVQTVNPPAGSVGLSQLSATGTKDSTTFLRGDNTFATAGGDNTPAFSAFLSTDQALSAATQKIICNNEIFDTDSAYNTSTGEFTIPTGEGGKYFINANVVIDVTTQLANYIYVNGSREAMGQRVIAGNARGLGISCILNLSAGDVVTYYIYVGASGNADASELGTYFQGYKLIGV